MIFSKQNYQGSTNWCEIRHRRMNVFISTILILIIELSHRGAKVEGKLIRCCCSKSLQDHIHSLQFNKTKRAEIEDARQSCCCCRGGKCCCCSRYKEMRNCCTCRTKSTAGHSQSLQFTKSLKLQSFSIAVNSVWQAHFEFLLAIAIYFFALMVLELEQ